MDTEQARLDLLERLLFDEGTSRNKQFELFTDDPTGQEAQSAARIIRSLRRDLGETGSRVERTVRDDGTVTVTVEIPRLSIVRSTHLTSGEVELLDRMLEEA